MINPFAIDEAPFGEPLSIVIGQSTQWRRKINIDNSLFNLNYMLRHYNPSPDDINYSIPMMSVEDGIFAVDQTELMVADWTADRYFWDLVVGQISDSRTKIIESGEIHVFGSTSDRRSHAAVMVAKIEGILGNRADNDVESYTIKSRSITKMSAKELMNWRDYYLREVSNQSANAGIFAINAPKNNTLRVRFR